MACCGLYYCDCVFIDEHMYVWWSNLNLYLKNILHAWSNLVFEFVFSRKSTVEAILE
jgi:hypothetical protein